MSQDVGNFSLAGLVVGSTGSVDLTPFTSSDPTASGAGGTLRLQNESGFVLQFLMRGSGDWFKLTAGQWVDWPLKASDTAATYTVVGSLPNPPIQLLLATYFERGEPVPPMNVLGNSPIGLSGSVAALVTQVINDTNPAVATVLEATPTTGPNAGISSAKINNDGSGYLGGSKLSFDNAGNLKTLAAFLWAMSGIGGGAPALLEVQPAGATVNNLWNLLYNGADGSLLFNDGTHAVNVLVLTPNSGINVPSGPIEGINGQGSAGSFGVPVIVAQAKDVNVTVTTLQTILTFTPPATGLYRLNAFFTHQNPSSPTNCTLSYTWTDPHTSSRPSGDFIIANSASYIILNGAGIGNNASILTVPVTVWASSTASIVIAFQDASGTPNDFVTALIERLA